PGTKGFTWNPIRARLVKDGRPRTGTQSNGKSVHSGTFCTRISPGCKNCYASVINKRFGTGLPFEVPHLAEHEFFIDQRILEEPLRRKKPATIFVGDMFDLFHEAITNELIAEVFHVIARSQQHVFQVLTKRTDRMHDWMAIAASGVNIPSIRIKLQFHWPMSHVWIGTSVESQKYADERIPLLLNTPAAVRFLSVEPLLERVDLTPFLRGIDWVICGGESGPGARQFNIKWATDLMKQCSEQGAKFFMKQVGSNCWLGQFPVYSVTRKGGKMDDWPVWLRVREFPA